MGKNYGMRNRDNLWQLGMLVHEKDSKVQLKSVDNSSNKDNVETDFPMVENGESVDSRINVQHKENSTCLKLWKLVVK